MTDLDEPLQRKIQRAVLEWARRHFNTDEVVIGQAAEDEADDDEATRYLVDFAVRSVGCWLVAEVWLDEGRILSVNDVGEGLPLEDPEWPWAQEPRVEDQG